MGIERICIVGAGNVGVALAVDISSKISGETVLLTQKEMDSPSEFVKVDSDSGQICRSGQIGVTSDYKTGIEGADIVFITLPSFLIEGCIKRISGYSPKIIVFVPGYGGKEYYCKQLMEKGCLVAGFDRSPYVARLSGKREVAASTKKGVRLACMSRKRTAEICGLVSHFVNFECHPLDNYLTVSLTPSNPILHTARLFSIFKDASKEAIFPRMIKFYGEWNDDSSKVLLAMDSELQLVCRQFKNIDLSGVTPLSIHYEADSVPALTEKIRSIKSWHTLDSPLRSADGQYLIDLESRYFQEDFSFGLGILKAYAQIAAVKTPVMDKVLEWYQRFAGVRVLDSNGNLDMNTAFGGGIPQKFGITTISDVEKFYLGGW